MPRPGEFIDLEKPLSAIEQHAPGDGAAGDAEGWVVLIGEGSDAEQTLNFLRELWPEVECEDMQRDGGERRSALQAET